MDRTVRELRNHSNGDVHPFVATQVMDVLDAAYNTARAYPGGVPALAARMQKRDKLGDFGAMNANTLQHKVDPNCFTHSLSLAEARDLMVLAGDYRILYALSADTGHVSIKTEADCSGLTMEKVGAMAKEFSDVLGAVTEAQAATSARGTSISPNEMARVEREAAELIAALNCLVANMRGQMKVER